MQNHTLKKLRTLALLSLIGNCTVAQNKEASDIKTPVENIKIIKIDINTFLTESLKEMPLHNMWEGAFRDSVSISELPPDQKQAGLNGYRDVQFANHFLSAIQTLSGLEKNDGTIDKLSVQIFPTGSIQGEVNICFPTGSKTITLGTRDKQQKTDVNILFPQVSDNLPKILLMDKDGQISVETPKTDSKTIFHNDLVHDIRFVHQMGGKSYLFDSSFRTETAPLTFTAIRDGKFNDTNMGILKMPSWQERRCFYYGHILDLTENSGKKKLNAPSIKTLPTLLKRQIIRAHNDMALARKIYPIIQKYIADQNIKANYDKIEVEVYNSSDLDFMVNLKSNNLYCARSFWLNEKGQKGQVRHCQSKQIIFDPQHPETVKVDNTTYIGNENDFLVKNNYGKIRFVSQGTTDSPITCIIHQIKTMDRDGKEMPIKLSDEFFKERTTFWKGHFSELLDGEDEKIFDFDSYIRKHPIIKIHKKLCRVNKFKLFEMSAYKSCTHPNHQAK